ncbi:NAD-dependent epimerase/dehydratase family protein [uncultured Bacteroides sp.]|uniref:NAD-dependent epimerase/dehydratase family protein n=1 Tax=uncultured Bacteroides sp. TaxID=162156 RepID=UPI002599790E|nr:NAD-dependent epimerase/dehydratase family protein [uncultured Bacteroides sp.]
MNILITGIHGFVGSNLVIALKRHHSLYGLDIVAPEKEGVVKTFAWKDIETTSFPMQQLPKFDAIIHLAGKAHDTKNQSASQLYFDINTGLTQKIFDFFLESSAKKFIFFSSVKAAADSVVGDMLTEDVIPTPVGPYGESKIAAESYIKEHFILPTTSSGYLPPLNSPVNRGKTTSPEEENVRYSDKRVYILRPCMIHGPGNKGNLNLLYNVVKKGIPWPLGDFENKRSFTSIDNLCYVVEGLLTKDVASGIYHMGDDEALSTNELIALMCEAMGKEPHIWKMNRKMMEGCAGLGTLLHLPLNTERLRKLTENYVVSNEKIKLALGIDRMPVRAADGIMKTIRSF